MWSILHICPISLQHGLCHVRRPLDVVKSPSPSILSLLLRHVFIIIITSVAGCGVCRHDYANWLKWFIMESLPLGWFVRTTFAVAAYFITSVRQATHRLHRQTQDGRQALVMTVASSSSTEDNIQQLPLTHAVLYTQSQS